MGLENQITEDKLPLYWKIIDLKEEWRLSALVERSGISDSHTFRAHRRARLIASYLVGERGEIEKKRITSLRDSLEENLYGPYFEKEIEADGQEHILSILKFLEGDGRNQLKMLSFSGNYVADLIRESLQLFDEKYPSKRELILTIVSALLTPLRQSIGSCFATAPAILIQKEQPQQLLIDLLELASTQKLIRVMGGEETSVPISPSVGLGDLLRPIQVDLSIFDSPALRAAFLRVGIEKLPFYDEYYLAKTPLQLIDLLLKNLLNPKSSDFPAKRRAVLSTFRSFTHHALLKAWEYTIASFADYKTGFHKWNLSAACGFEPQEKGGLGELMVSEIESKLEESNKKIQEIQGEYERAYDRVRMGESLLKQADSTSRMQQRKAELSGYMGEFYSLEDRRDRHQRDAEHLSKLFPVLINNYTGRLEEEFQEVYDPEMGEFRSHQFEDSPAGFRLVYKHGRADPGTWTFINSADEYQNSLRDFFLRVEAEIREDFVTELTGRIIERVLSEEFLSGAMKRVENLHKKVRAARGGEEHLLTPWSYISGGTMQNLIQCYFGLEALPKEESRPMQDATDLLIFYFDTLKGLPWKNLEKFSKDPKLGLLAFSPTHAFTLRPGLKPFREGWLSEQFTYTWVRDEIIGKANAFYVKDLTWDEQTILLDLIELSSSSLTKAKRSIPAFRKELEGLFGRGILDSVDSVIRRSLPFVSGKPFYKHLEEKRGEEELFSKELEKVDGPPEAILFADSNWSHYYFGFIYNPGTEKLELWRVDRSGLFGSPMSSWQKHFANSLPWGLLIEPVRRGPILPEWFSYKV